MNPVPIDQFRPVELHGTPTGVAFVGVSISLLSWGSQVRVLPRLPILNEFRGFPGLARRISRVFRTLNVHFDQLLTSVARSHLRPDVSGGLR